jgi:hypothetical protein
LHYFKYDRNNLKEKTLNFVLKRILHKRLTIIDVINHTFKKTVLLPLVFILLLFLFGCGGNDSSAGVSHGSNTDESASVGTGTVTLHWNAPNTNSNGSTLTDLAGYRVSYGPGSGQQNRTKSVDIGNYTSASVSNLSTGDWCFVVSAYDTSGNESLPSPEVCKTI